MLLVSPLPSRRESIALLLHFSKHSPIALLSCALCLAIGLVAGSVEAKVVVLSNRTQSTIHCTLVETGKAARQIVLEPGDSKPSFYSSSLQVHYQDAQKEHVYDLAEANAYFFTLGLEDGALHFERIGLGDDAFDPDSPRQLRQQPAATATIQVKLLVDDDEPTHRRVWEARLRKRIAAASQVLEMHSGVRLQVVQVATWDSDDSQNQFALSLREFEREVSPQPAQLAIGFSSQYQISHGRTHMGGTRGTLHPYILLKERSPNIRETERLEFLVHELGHYLGAAHSPEPLSVMRPLIAGGLQRAAGSHIQFDPVNTLLIALMGEELSHSGVRSLLDVSTPTKRRMMQIYGVLGEALPDDPAARQYLQLLRQATSSAILDDSRKVLDTLVQAAKTRTSDFSTPSGEKNQPLGGDELTNYYVRKAAATSQRLAPENAAKAFLLALGIFVDDTEMLRAFPATQGFVKVVESDLLRRERLRFMGSPTMRDRSDLAKHFFVSAHTTAVMGSNATRAVGLAKELLDARRGSGFSFADMAANRAGIAFAEHLLSGSISLAELARDFRTESYLPPIADLLEGLGSEQLQQQFGNAENEALASELSQIEHLILSQPVYQRR
ncbi:MAG: hypothetical protein KDA57_13535 [Planctomycetales bacterium]|nr:hypothetical protein [Planctomycetales bacterium]